MIRKILSYPFSVVGVISLAIGLAIRFDLEGATTILNKFKTILEKFRKERGI